MLGLRAVTNFVIFAAAMSLASTCNEARAERSIGVPAKSQAAPAPAPAKRDVKPAPSSTEPPMEVHLVRSADPGCEPNCPEWIAAQGRIDANSLRRFKTVLKQAGKRELPVFLHSGGGSVHEAMAFARTLRNKGLDTVVAKTLFSPCSPTDTACRKRDPQGALRGSPHFLSICASACTFILAAGKHRYAGPFALVGVHQIKSFQTFRKVYRTYRVTTLPGGMTSRELMSEKTLSQRTVETKTDDSAYVEIKNFFAEMGVAKEMVALFKSTPNASVRWLTRAELMQTLLITDRKDGAQLLAEALVKARTGQITPTTTVITPAGSPEKTPTSSSSPRNGAIGQRH